MEVEVKLSRFLSGLVAVDKKLVEFLEGGFVVEELTGVDKPVAVAEEIAVAQVGLAVGIEGGYSEGLVEELSARERQLVEAGRQWLSEPLAEEDFVIELGRIYLEVVQQPKTLALLE